MPPSKNISFDELSKYFHLPINQVAKELGVCATILKKICRRNGIPRWPHRKIKSLDKMISNLNMNLEKNPNERDDILREIDLLKSKKLEIMKNPDVLVEIPKGAHSIVPSGTDFLARPSPSKVVKPSSSKPKSPYGLTSFKVKEILEGTDTPLNCFSSVSYYSERQQYVDTPPPPPQQRIVEQKPIVEASAFQRPTYHNPVPSQPADMPFSFELPKPAQYPPMSPAMAPPRPPIQNMTPPPGVTHNFLIPSFDFYPAPELPALRFQDWESKYKRTLPVLEPMTPSHQQPASNTQSFPSVAQVISPSRSFSISEISQPTQTPMFPDWYTQEKDRIFRSASAVTSNQ